MSGSLITYLNVYAFTLLTLPLASQIMHHVECIEQEPLEVREGEGKNKGTRGDGGKTLCVRGEWCLALKAKLVVSHCFLAFHIFC